MKKIKINSPQKTLKQEWTKWLVQNKLDLTLDRDDYTIRDFIKVKLGQKTFNLKRNQIALIEKFLDDCCQITFHDWTPVSANQSNDPIQQFTLWKCLNCGLRFKQHNIDMNFKTSLFESFVPDVCEDVVDKNVIYENQDTVSKLEMIVNNFIKN